MTLHNEEEVAEAVHRAASLVHGCMTVMGTSHRMPSHEEVYDRICEMAVLLTTLESDAVNRYPIMVTKHNDHLMVHMEMGKLPLLDMTEDTATS